MSGRSAHVRSKKKVVAESKSRIKSSYPAEVEDEGLRTFAPAAQPPAPVAPPTPPYAGPPSLQRRVSLSPSVSSDGGSNQAFAPQAPTPYMHSGSKARQQPAKVDYPAPPQLPRPIIVTSAIEKSDFRSQVDGMSKNVRSKLGRFVGKQHGDPSRDPNLRMPTSSAASGSHTSSSGNTRPTLAHSSTTTSGMTAAGNQFAHLTISNDEDGTQKQSKSSQHNIRRFEGGKRPQAQWNSQEHVGDDDLQAVTGADREKTSALNDETGDTSVYMYTLGSTVKPPPSFRVSSRVIRESGSKMLIDQLHDRSVPAGWPHANSLENPSPESSAGTGDSNSSDQSKSNSEYEDGPFRVDTSKSNSVNEYEIYIPYPGDHTGVNAMTWHITTRNFLAILFDDPAICGTSLYEALARVLERLDASPDYLDREDNHVSFINSYLTRHQFDNVVNQPSLAVSMLAWSEIPEVQWREGYLEAFVHCAGMYEEGVQEVSEWRHISSRTKILLLNAKLEMDERYHRAQKFLGRLDFSSMWPATLPALFPERLAFDRFRQWLCRYYEQRCPTWPMGSTEHSWLTRGIVQRLAKDMYSLYDYLVDRNIMFDGSEYRGRGRNWVMISLSGPTFHADSSTLPLTKIITDFDDRWEFPHIPHPYAITPPSIPATPRSKGFTMKRTESSPDLHAQSRRKALAYSEASNVYILRGGEADSELVADFIQFEQSDQIEAVDPFEARRGRWLLIYGILQVLSTVSVDSPQVRHTTGAMYHLSAQMKGLVPWAPPGSPPEVEATHTLSHTFTVPESWPTTVGRTRNTQHRPIMWGQYGDGRSRVPDESLAHASSTARAPGSGHSSGSDPPTGRDMDNVVTVTTTTVQSASPASPHSMLVRSPSRSHADGHAPGTAITEGAAPPPLKSNVSSASAGVEGRPLKPVESRPAKPTRALTVQEWLEDTRADGTSISKGNREQRWSGTATVLTGEAGDPVTPGAVGTEPENLARKKRAMVHGFTDFKVPEEW